MDATPAQKFARMFPNVAFQQASFLSPTPQDNGGMALRADLDNAFSDADSRVSENGISEASVEAIVTLRQSFAAVVDRLLEFQAKKDAFIMNRDTREIAPLHKGATDAAVQANKALGEFLRGCSNVPGLADEEVGFFKEVFNVAKAAGALIAEAVNAHAKSLQREPSISESSISESVLKSSGLTYGFVTKSFPDKGFCFLNTPQGQVFVHAAAHVTYFDTSEGYKMRQTRAAVPAVGTEVLLRVEQGEKGLKAKFWLTPENFRTPIFDRPARSSASIRIEEPVYRVFEQYTTTGATPGKDEVVFTGTARELRAKYKKGPGYDDLGNFSHDDFSVRRRVEVKGPDGTWSPCGDPR